MKKLLPKLSTVALALSIAAFAFSQNPSTFTLESHLTDIEGEAVASAKIDASLFILNSDGEQCFEIEKTLVTKEDGSFSLYAQDLPPVFTKGVGSEPAVIQLTITSPNGDSWLEEDKFVVKYLFTIEGSADITEYVLTRMEGQMLNYEYATDIWKFDDVYPFAYIRSTFLVSFNDEITDVESLLLAADALFKANEENLKGDPAIEEEPSSRGLKGAAAVGGYKAKQ